MKLTVAIAAPGEMGAAVGARLVEHGVTVLTSLEGRSEQSRSRAAEAGMHVSDDAGLCRADIVLSIVPPSQALPFARRLGPHLAAARQKSLYVDCNAVSVSTVKAIEATIAPTGALFCDASILGGPPLPGKAGPKFYASGDGAADFARLRDAGLRIELMQAPAGAASAVKMAYAGITKGLTGVAAAITLTAQRHGVEDILRREIGETLPDITAWLGGTISRMYDKAHRFAGEMEEIAEFAEDSAATADVYAGLAQFYSRIAEDRAGRQVDIETLKAFWRPSA